MTLPSLEEAKRLLAEKKISKQRFYQIEHAHLGLCRFCSRKAIRGVRCGQCAKKQSERRAKKGAQIATCKRCGRKGHYQKTCNAKVTNETKS